MRFLLCTLLLCACKTSLEQSAIAHSNVADRLDLQQEVHEARVTTAPVERHIIERWTRITPQIARGVSVPEDDGPDELDPMPQPEFVNPYEYERETFETLAPVDKTETQTSNKATGNLEAKSDSHTELERTRDFLHSPFTLVGALLVAGGVAFAIWKARKAVPL